MDLLRIPELFAAFLDFLLDFAVAPGETLHSYASAAALDNTLFIFLLAGATSAYFIILTADKSGLKPDRKVVKESHGPIVAALLGSDLDSKIVPLVSVFFIYPAAILFHLSVRLYSFVVALVSDNTWVVGGLDGTVRDTINAAFAFGAFYLPLWAVTVVLITWLAQAERRQAKPRQTFWLSIAVELGLASLFFVYFPAALAGVHTGTSFWEAFWAFVYGMGGWVIILLIFVGMIVRVIATALRLVARAVRRAGG